MRLATRITLIAGLGVPLLVVLCGWSLFLLIAHDLHTEQDAHLRKRAASVVEDARRMLRVTADGKPVIAQQRERAMFGAALDVGVRVEGPSGVVAGGPQPPAGTELPTAATGPVTIEASTSAGGDRSDSWRVLVREIDGSHPGVHGRLWLFASDSAGREQLDSVRSRVVWVALGAAPLSALVAWLAASRASRPLRLLQRQAGGLDPAVGSARLEHAPTGVSEVDELAGTLTTVLARYDEQVLRARSALETARSFASTAGHELRTPMTSMRTNLDVLAEWEGLEPGELREIIDDLRHEHDRMLGLLVMLRELGRGELASHEAMVPVDMADIVEAAAEDARRRRPEADLRLDLPTGACVIRGWEHGLRTLVDNLLANALSHGRDPDSRQAHVTVSLCAARGVVVLRVDDSGPGIAPHLRQTVLERFHRAPDSEGHGLGLALVAQQATLHGAALRLDEVPDGRGTRAEIQFAAAGAREG